MLYWRETDSTANIASANKDFVSWKSAEQSKKEGF
jgi:hypothetical protein